jgi:hypothetical protein
MNGQLHGTAALYPEKKKHPDTDLRKLGGLQNFSGHCEKG